MINLDDPLRSFNYHFEDAENERILFSAPFGSGKTYFLKHYFDSYNQNANTFWLSPVNYVVSQNEDIFEYIKVDIALQLIQYNPIKSQLEKKYGEDLFIYSFFVNNTKEILKLLFTGLEAVNKLPVVGDTLGMVGKAGNGVLTTYDKYVEFKEKIGRELDNNFVKLVNFIDSNTKIKGSIFEDDLVSQLLRESLDIVKQEKENVLIIDDLDRLDPEHIFRILNIMTVHNNNADGRNKFNFDKVIMVCDYDNIKHIYMHKYGPEVDFNGYMEKYYSTNIFRFSNKDAIDLYIMENLFDEIDVAHKRIISLVLRYFVNSSKLTIRSIIKARLSFDYPDIILLSSKIRIPESDLLNVYPEALLNEIFIEKNFDIYSEDLPIIKVIRILSTIFGDYKSFRQAVFDRKNGYGVVGVKEDLIACEEVLVYVINIISNYSKPSEIFFRLSKVENNNSRYGAPTVYNYYMPSVHVLGHEYTVDFGWNKENPYKTYNILRNTGKMRKPVVTEKDPFGRKIELKTNVTSFEILEEFEKILTFLEDKKLVGIIGLTQ